ncbi:MAG: alpha-L-fucosidase, partial [Clostridia bacterium]|nr:alpha-L-fucosidase [Clostridia bacterium]
MSEKIMVDVTIEEHQKHRAGKNDPQKTEQFRDFGFGMFIHFSLDSLFCSVISHWMVAADPKLCDKFIDEYPQKFRISDFDPKKWAFLAQQAGARYAVFTAKHHNGFCMWDTDTTDFKVTKTPFGRDLLKEYFAAFEEYGIEAGLYFSPIDFYYNHRINHRTLQFATPDMLQENDPGLLAYNEQ